MPLKQVAATESVGGPLIEGRYGRDPDDLSVWVSPLLRKALATMNPIESAFSVVEKICSQVKYWQRGDHIERWMGSVLWLAEKKFRRVKGYKDLP